MNLSVGDVKGGVLLVSQFTLVADTSSGTRPGFSTAKPPVEAEELYDYFVHQMQKTHDTVATGIFGADMQVSLTNDGPVTFLLEC
jgi:D-tyrosyl-tRNA(Tyr) deacylase